MGTRLESLYFNFAGRWSSDFNIIHISLNDGMFEETFVANRELSEQRIRGRNKPYFNEITEDPLEFELAFAFKDTYDEDLIREVINWLYQDYYKPLYFYEEQSKIYYCTPISDSQIVHNGLKEGYVKIKMRCDSSRVYSPTYLTNEFEVKGSKNRIITLENRGDFDIKPEISIKKVGNGNLKIENNLTHGQYFQINNLLDSEDLYINCEREVVETDVPGMFRYNDVLGEYPTLLYGINNLEIQGDCVIQFRYNYEFRF